MTSGGSQSCAAKGAPQHSPRKHAENVLENRSAEIIQRSCLHRFNAPAAGNGY